MRPREILVIRLNILSSHLQSRMSKDPLEIKGVPSIPDVLFTEESPKGMKTPLRLLDLYRPKYDQEISSYVIVSQLDSFSRAKYKLMIMGVKPPEEMLPTLQADGTLLSLSPFPFNVTSKLPQSISPLSRLRASDTLAPVSISKKSNAIIRFPVLDLGL